MMNRVKSLVKMGKHPKMAIAQALSEKHMKKMAKGGMVDENEPSDMAVIGGGLSKDESMSEMSEMGEGSEMRGLEELDSDGDMDPASVANPASLAKAFMKAYAMGGLVQAGPEEDEMMHGNQPEEHMNYSTEEPMSSMPKKPSSSSDGMGMEPKGMGLSSEAMDAIKAKKMKRRFGIYNPKA